MSKKKVRYFIEDASLNSAGEPAGADWLYTRHPFKPTKKSAFRFAQAGANATGCLMAIFTITYKLPESRKKVKRVWVVNPAQEAK